MQETIVKPERQRKIWRSGWFVLGLLLAVAFGLYTDGGAMVYADATTLRNVGIPAGDGMLMRFPVDDAIAEQWASYGANVTGVQASAAFRDDTD